MTTWVSTLGTICTVGVGAMALYQGEKVERLIATSLLAGLLIAPMLDTPGRTHGLQIGSTLADVILIAATFYGVATTQKRWLLVAAAFQLLATVTDLLASLDPGVDTWTTRLSNSGSDVTQRPAPKCPSLNLRFSATFACSLTTEATRPSIRKARVSGVMTPASSLLRSSSVRSNSSSVARLRSA